MANKKALNADLHHMHSTSFDKEMLEVGVFQLFYNLGMGLLNLSLIFYMYSTLEYLVWQIFAFYLFWQFAFTLVQPFVGGIISKIGLKHSIGLRALGTLILFLPLPYLMTADFWETILLVAPLFLIRSFCYGSSTVAYDIFLTHHLNKESKGSVLAWMKIAVMLAGVVAPLLGALITDYWGFEYLTYVGCLSFVIGGIVLLLTPDEKVNVPYSSGKLLKDTLHTSKFLFLAEFGRVFFDAVMWIMWPIFLILVLSDLVSLGLLISVSSGISMLCAYFIGRLIDRGRKKSAVLLRLGAYRSVVLNFFRAFWFEPIVLSIIDALNKLNDQTIQIPYDVEFYAWMKDGNTLEKSHIRRVISENLYTLSMFVFTVLFYLNPDSPTWLFVTIFAIGALSLILLSKISRVFDLC